MDEQPIDVTQEYLVARQVPGRWDRGYVTQWWTGTKWTRRKDQAMVFVGEGLAGQVAQDHGGYLVAVIYYGNLFTTGRERMP